MALPDLMKALRKLASEPDRAERLLAAEMQINDYLSWLDGSAWQSARMSLLDAVRAEPRVGKHESEFWSDIQNYI